MDRKNAKILIADDNRDIHYDIKYILDSSSDEIEDYQETRLLKEELFGKTAISPKSERVIDIKYRIDDAYQGEEAVKMVKTAKESGDPYSLVFMDVRMPPGIDGIETIERIWTIDSNVGVVICTAFSDYSWDQIITKLGQNDNLLFLRKPFDNVSLKQVALTMTTKWNLKIQVNEHIENLEKQVEMRTSELTDMVYKLRDEISLREEKEKQLIYSAHYDQLTELLNRRSFYSFLYNLPYGETDNFYSDKVSLFYIDMDDFKSVNDIFGHDTGDKLLIEVSKRIKEVLADYTLAVTDYVSENGQISAIYRLGGDEFIAVIEEDDRETLGIIAQKIIDAINEPFFIAGYELNAACSIGISIFRRRENLTRDAQLKFADMALYEAKRVRGTYRFYSQFDAASLLNELRLEKDLKRAVDSNQIDVYFQRLVNTQDETIGVQSLVRWLHPRFGELGPDQFIHIAEKTDLIITLGRNVLRKSLGHLKQMQKDGYANFFVMVNCTTREFYSPSFVSSVKDEVLNAGVDPNCLKLSLEERFSFQAKPSALAIIRELNDFGVQFAVNGFENDYQTFAFLQQVPRDTIIRLNRDYVKNITTDEKDLRFLHSLMDIIDAWDLNIIITGIETEEQKHSLNTRNCILQGYHFNIPKPYDQFMNDLKAGE